MTYNPPEPDYRRLSDLQSGIDEWYSPATLRSEVERVRRETVEDCAELVEMHDLCNPTYIAKSVRSLK